ncbi:MAG TPA: aminotransferase class I/II-fold pyridoxal phosphate-dependent enzyme [Saprospiraceae bacterium]|nr:aminotransferase class I/II-fold pyridoxal phosphate-dependent enzyme [Saprospiraceae bacterium]HPI06662.1 aminotransferase class I/II-fold pyridoxal phosphate-dependent enzyme [Saprospiraceae bacterium]
MIAPAKRLDSVNEYYFAGKLREIAQMQREGKPVLNLGIGSPDQPPHPAVLEALQQGAANPKAHGYQSYTGIPALREAWAAWYKEYYHVSLNPENQILPLIGSKEGIVHVAMAFLEPGDVALVPNPGYPAYSAATQLAGATVQLYELKEANDWLPDFEELEKSDLTKVKVLWANYPHMPTGAPGSAAVFQALVDFGKKHNILIINDNPYSFILNEHPRSILAASGAEEVALELNSLSKSHNMAGWRVGMVAGHPEYLKSVLRFKSNMDSGQFQPVQLAAVKALQLPATWYSELNAMYRERQQVAFQILESIDCVFDRQQQGMFVWAKIPDHYADCYALSDELLYERHVFLTPGGIFGSNGDRFVRISLCSDVPTLQTALQKIQSAITI